MVRRKFVGKFRRNSDEFTVNRNVIGNSSEYTDELPTTTTVTFFIGMSSKSRRKIPTTLVSSEFRRKWPTKFRRLQFFGFGRKLVGNPSQMSDDVDVRRNLRRNSACFLVVVVNRDRARRSARDKRGAKVEAAAREETLGRDVGWEPPEKQTILVVSKLPENAIRVISKEGGADHGKDNTKNSKRT
ncbi:hypothetical protein F2Q68_00008190 [Brassica cretica]|uniref:Uncharacterized protein n=1 Tax=Brassica cretica TaxID=69181 RepID=A0A8S9L249_BRACR|nr:hypothetical protein F2Q68_00008190 [Brassica cretica]